MSMRKVRLALLLLLAGLVLTAYSGKFLIIDEPEKSDVIVVLAGETDRRPARALELLGQGYGTTVIIDVSATEKIYQWSVTELAERYIAILPQSSAIRICPIQGLSTREEAKDALRCIQQVGGRRVLLVTSDYHTRRALSIYRTLFPGFAFSVAAAYDSRQFGPQWWHHRQWAKTNLDEWLRLLWWQGAERWR
jgi:uncharacterized SAM-binding protein YcdF (DUF218 family)